MASFVTRWRVRTGYPLAILYWWLARPSWRSLAVGAVIAVIGLVVRAAAAGHLRKSQALTTSGPYAWTRNPLYLGSTLIAAGFGVAGNSWWAALVLVIYFCAFYPAVMRKEEGELEKRYGDAFTEYARRVPLFFPWAPRGNKGDAAVRQFSWGQYGRNREYQAAMGVVGALALVWVRGWIREKWGW